jgi:hypothetical protein
MFKFHIRVGVLAHLVFWLCKNDKVFNGKKFFAYVGYIYQCIATFRSWSFLQYIENCDLFMKISTRLKDMAMVIFFI